MSVVFFLFFLFHSRKHTLLAAGQSVVGAVRGEEGGGGCWDAFVVFEFFFFPRLFCFKKQTGLLVLGRVLLHLLLVTSLVIDSHLLVLGLVAQTTPLLAEGLGNLSDAHARVLLEHFGALVFGEEEVGGQGALGGVGVLDLLRFAFAGSGGFLGRLLSRSFGHGGRTSEGSAGNECNRLLKTFSSPRSLLHFKFSNLAGQAKTVPKFPHPTVFGGKTKKTQTPPAEEKTEEKLKHTRFKEKQRQMGRISKKKCANVQTRARERASERHEEETDVPIGFVKNN